MSCNDQTLRHRACVWSVNFDTWIPQVPQGKWLDGNLDKCEYQVYGCKMNFDNLSHKLFKKHEAYMQLTSEDVISKLSSEELSQRVSKFEAPETNDCQYLM